jgi:subtilisin-like proprotein convertase family protein
MLAQNPSLIWRDVKHILARSSVRINPTDPGWTSGTFAHNEKFGFGLVDAQAAVNLAATWINVAAESAVPAITRVINQTIPDNDASGLIDSMTIGNGFANFAIEYVEVEFDATHPYRGDLEITLTSPAGVVSRLATVRPRDPGDNFTSWRFGSVRHWGESAAGTWTLRVSDRDVPDVGTWNSWTLRIYGTAPPLTLTTSSLPTGEQGVAYPYGLLAEGGFPPYTWSLIKGKLPNGLTLNAAGALSGIPTKAKTATFTAQVTDTAGASVRRDLSLRIVKSVKLKTSSLSRGRVGTPYSAMLQATRGIPPLTFSLTAGALPPGLTLDPGTGQISGTPTVAGTFDFQVRVASSGGSSDQRNIRIRIK